MKAKTAGRAKSVPSLSGFIEPRRWFLNRTIVYCSMMYCCYFHFKYSFNYCFNCSLNHFWDKQQQPHMRMAKLHKSFTITVTLVVCFVHSFLERGFYVFYAHIGDNLTESRLRGNWNGEWAKPTRRDADLQHAPLLIKNSTTCQQCQLWEGVQHIT